MQIFLSGFHNFDINVKFPEMVSRAQNVLAVIDMAPQQPDS